MPPREVNAAYGHSVAVCAFEAKMALFAAATRAGFAHDRRDEKVATKWRILAAEAREWLWRAHGGRKAEQLSLGVAP